jgi:hydroxyacylglutathione hydrolase
MKVISNTGGLAHTHCYVVADDTTGKCVLFDAPDHTTGPLLKDIVRNQWTLIGLWLTHGHFDHIADHKVVTDAFADTPILIHKIDEAKLIQPMSRIFPLPFQIPPGRATGYVEDGQILNIGTLTCQVIFTPGHSPGHVMYYFETEKLLIGGDLIIGGAVGRYDLPDSSIDALCHSVRRIMTLPPDTTLLPGHGEPTTLGDELKHNAFVQQIMSAV